MRCLPVVRGGGFFPAQSAQSHCTEVNNPFTRLINICFGPNGSNSNVDPNSIPCFSPTEAGEDKRSSDDDERLKGVGVHESSQASCPDIEYFMLLIFDDIKRAGRVRARTCDGVQGRDEEQGDDGDVDVQAQRLLDEHGSREHVHLQTQTHPRVRAEPRGNLASNGMGEGRGGGTH